MADTKTVAHWSRWAVVLPAVGVAITGGALWYNNFFGSDEKIDDTIEINQPTYGGPVNVDGDNSGTINTGSINNSGSVNTDGADQ